MLKRWQKTLDIEITKMYSKGVKKKGSERNMKKATTLLVTLVLVLGAVKGLSQEAKKITSMIEHTSIVSVNDSSCSDMEFIQFLYYKDKSLQEHYDDKPIEVYVYHEYDALGFSHNEIEVNFTHYSLRYDL